MRNDWLRLPTRTALLGAALGAGLFALGACGGGGGGADAVVAGALEDAAASFGVVASGDDSGYLATPSGAEGSSEDLVLASETELDLFWAVHAPGTTAPIVDFSRELVIAAVLEEKPLPGYAVEIGAVLVDPATGGLEVEVIEEEPAATGTAEAGPVRPFAIIRTARPSATDAAGRPLVSFRHLIRLPFGTLARGNPSCYDTASVSAVGLPLLLGFRDKASFAGFWQRHSCDAAAPPFLSFSHRMALACISDASAGATSIEVVEVLYDRNAKVILVRAAEDRSVPTTSIAVSRPYHIVFCRNVEGVLKLRHEIVRRFRTLAEGTISGYRYGDETFAGENLVLREEGEYLALWAEHASLEGPLPPVPAVHFPREMALASVFGYWPTSGAQIEVVRVSETWFGALRVDIVKRAEPGVLPLVTNPFHFVATSMWRGPVFFVSRPDMTPSRATTDAGPY